MKFDAGTLNSSLQHSISQGSKQICSTIYEIHVKLYEPGIGCKHDYILLFHVMRKPECCKWLTARRFSASNLLGKDITEMLLALMNLLCAIC